MSQSTGSRRSRKATDRPKKPYPDFPLTPHATGTWQKKIRGKIHYFGKWARRVNGKLERIPGDGWEEALKSYKAQADDLHAGRTPRLNTDGLTVADLCNRFLTAKLRKKDSGELGGRMFTDYKKITDEIVAAFGKTRLVDDLAANDFESLRATMAKKWGPVRLGNAITRVKSVFKYGIDNVLIEKAIRYGSEFKKPGKTVLRRQRVKSGKKMIEAGEIRALIQDAVVDGGTGLPPVRVDLAMRAMILLGINCGFGNHDCATLPRSALDLNGGWIDFPRPKTSIDRRCPLWPETTAALRMAIENRPDPVRDEDRDLVFISSRKTAFIRTTEKSHTDLISVQFGEWLKKLGAHRDGLGFYSLRHTFRTIADAAKDPVATDLIMGHTDPSMGARYREQLDDSRLRTVADYVRGWLFGSEGKAGGAA
jgi:integrase